MGFDLAPLQNLIDQFERMQGIGHKTAQRMAFYVLGLSDEQAARICTGHNRCAIQRLSSDKFAVILQMMTYALFVKARQGINPLFV